MQLAKASYITTSLTASVMLLNKIAALIIGKSQSSKNFCWSNNDFPLQLATLELA